MQTLTFNNGLFASHIHSKRTLWLKISVREAAKEVGVSSATLSRVENCNMPDTITYALLCKWLNEPMERYFEIK